MQTVIRKRYSTEFRVRAVELVRLGKPVSLAAEELGIGTSVLYRWLGQGPHSQVVGLEGVGGTVEEAPEIELRRLRREIANLKLENDILKKAAVILGTKPQPPPAR